MAPLKLQNKAKLASVSVSERRRSPRQRVQKIHKPGAYSIQLAAYADLHDAVRGQSILTRRLPNNLPQLGIFARHGSEATDSRVKYRLRSRDPTSRSRALTLCRTVTAAGFSCLPIRHTSSAWRLVGDDEVLQAARPAGHRSKTTNRIRVAVKRSVRKPARSVRGADHEKPLFRIQLAAYRQLSRAVYGKQILSRTLPGTFPSLEILKRNGIARDSARINYWVRSRDLWHEGRAQALCDEARSAGHACLLIEPQSTVWRPVVANR